MRLFATAILLLLVSSTSFAGSIADRVGLEETLLEKKQLSAKEACKQKDNYVDQTACEDRAEEYFNKKLTFLHDEPEQYFYEKDEKKETKNTSKYSD